MFLFFENVFMKTYMGSLAHQAQNRVLENVFRVVQMCIGLDQFRLDLVVIVLARLAKSTQFSARK